MHTHPNRVGRGSIVVFVLAVGLVGCGGGGGKTSAPTSGYMTARQVADKLRPLGCNARRAAPSEELTGSIKPVNELECTIKGETTTIAEYQAAEQVEHEMNLAKGIGCQIAKQYGITEFHTVRGENWFATPDTRATAEAIKNAIGGDVKLSSVQC